MNMSIEIDLAAPVMLIAVPQLGDPNFNRGVVLMLEHNEQGSMGLIINQPTHLNMGVFCASQGVPFTGKKSQSIHQGGPVQTDRAFILHISEHEGPETEAVTVGMRLSYSMESLRGLASNPPDLLRVYLGYAGWGPNQLAEEVTAGAWLLAPVNDHLVFNVSPEMMWETALSDLGIAPMQLVHSGAMH